LRTPLNAIIGFSEILTDQTFGELNSKQLKYSHNILNSGRHLLQLINDILDLSKVEAGRLEVARTAFPPAKALREVQTIVKALAHKKTIALDFQVADDLPPLLADEGKFKQIMYNLLSNAIKFTPDRGRVTVTASLIHTPAVAPAQPAESLKISVSDTGIGIQPQDHERIFIEFEQVDSSYGRQQQGTGLGLALTKRLIELHGGKIWVESEGIESKGSTFTFVLPVLKAEPVVASSPDDPGKHTVLVIEDDPACLAMLVRTLAGRGFQTLQATDGRTGVNLAAEHHPEVIILDLGMPDCSGDQVVEELRAHPHTSGIPILIHTGTVLAEPERQRLAAHVQAISLKTETNSLLANLERWRKPQPASLTAVNS
jgi:CheY-like chemotaxis protein